MDYKKFKEKFPLEKESKKSESKEDETLVLGKSEIELNPKLDKESVQH